MARKRSSASPLIAPGAQVVVRDEEWLVRSVRGTASDGDMVVATGTSEMVRDEDAVFFTELEDVTPLRPEDTKLAVDDSPGFRRSRLFLEALLRRTPFPVSTSKLVVGHRQLLDELDYQRRPAKLALEALRPRLLIADAVGLGKTLEIGIILSELIRRGRGDRILVVTPKHILEQFQHELWTRFAIPLVRLDSEGIQRVKQRIPATRNPFTYFKRVIISIDTLKNTDRYRHHLEGIHWDAVVIDECHNLVNRGTLNNQLANVLAPRTDALLLASATPHNGKPESFAELVRLLDPTAIADPRDYDSADIEHLYVRRHKHSQDVSAEVGDNWAERRDPIGVHAPANPAEEAVFAELAGTWLYPPGGPPCADRLFPYTLLKGFLSSHRALAESVEQRRKRLAIAATAASAGATPGMQAEDEALERLGKLAAAVDDAGSSKLVALVRALREIGVGAGSATRAVVFSERHATLNWLAQSLPGLLRLPPGAVRVLHGSLPDDEQMQIVEDFALESSAVRLLLTGDVAAEGVNLHRQCHHLIHFDLPWSLITIEQRNGRIDRYGQRHRPEIRALLLTSTHDRLQGDLDVLDRLLDKEHAAHRALGDAGALMHLRTADAEEREITGALARRGTSPGESADAFLERVVPSQASGFDLMMAITGQLGGEPVGTGEPMRLFATDEAFLEEALREAYDDPGKELDVRREPEHGLITFVPPLDLRRRLEALPQSYLTEQRVLDRLRLTSDRIVAEEMLRRARESSDSIWPEVLYLSSQHPVMDWLVDKVLTRFGRNEAPVIVAPVSSPTFLLQGMYSNERGQPTIVEWMAVDRLGDKRVEPHVRPMDVVLREAGVGPNLANVGVPPDLPALQALVETAVDVGRQWMRRERDRRDQALRARVQSYADRLRHWKREAEQLTLAIDSMPTRKHKQRQVAEVVTSTEKLIKQLGTSGDPLVRVVAVLVGAQ